MQNIFNTVPTVFNAALEAEQAGNFESWGEQMRPLLGYTEDKASETFAAHFAEAKAAAALKLATLAVDKEIKGFTLSDSIKAILGRISSIFEDNGVGAPPTVSLTLTLDQTGENNAYNVAWSTGKTRKARTTSDGVSTTSNISAWTAYKAGVKKGDPDDVSKVSRGVYLTPSGEVGSGRERSLVDYFRDNQAVYGNTAETLQRYGKL